jgi:hypothetical protein
MIVVSSLREQPLASFAGLAIIAAGIPLFYWVQSAGRSRLLVEDAEFDAVRVAAKSAKA